MARKVAQMHMDDHIIESRKLLNALEKWEDLGDKAKEARDKYHAQDERAKGIVLAMEDLPTGVRLRCGPYVIRLKDEQAREVKSRRRARRAVKIQRAG